VIPFGRGPSRSAPIGAIAARARALAAAGYPEIVLTGVDLTSYGHDLPGRPRLGQMIRRLLAAAPEVRRLRLSSIDVAEVDDDLMRLIADEPRFAPHLHLSLQSGDDMILKRMKRRHSRAQAVDFCAEARRLRPDIAFGADVIVGFPTETDAMFENSLRLLADCDLTHLHVFPYSPRPGTPAARMPQVDGPTRKARAAVLRAAGDAALAARAHARIGRRASLAIEAAGDHMQGRDSDFMPADVDGDAVVGDLRAGTIIGARNGRLIVALDREAAAA
ncbi:MAG: radical SAM protein, partial [Pseudomonadota bacterium]